MKLLGVQLLRGLAACLVVLFHAQVVGPELGVGRSTSAQWMGQLGTYGVDLFFVLSGFILRFAEPQSGYEPGSFLTRRLIRVIPTYWLLTSLAVLLSFLFVQSGSAHIDAVWAVKSYAFAAFSEGRQPLLYVGWSLEFEMFFYLVLFACLLVWRRPWTQLVVLLCALSSVGGVLVLAKVDAFPNVRGFFLDRLLLEFALGVELAGFLRTHEMKVRRLVVLGAALGVTLAAYWSTWGSRVIVAGLPAVAVLALVVWLEQTGKLKIARFWVTLGDASYSIYLLQVFLISAVAKGGRALGISNPDALVIWAAAGSVAGGVLFHRRVERPLGQRLTKLLFSLPSHDHSVPPTPQSGLIRSP